MDPCVGKSPLRSEITTQRQYSCLENFKDRGAWQPTVHGVAKSHTRLRTSTFMLLSHCFLENFLSSDAQYGELRTTVLKSKFPGGFSVKESLPVGLGEISESSISLPSVQSVSLLTVLFTKLLLLLLEGSTGSTSGEANAWTRSSASSSSSELKGGVLNKPKSKQGALFPCFRIYRQYAP